MKTFTFLAVSTFVLLVGCTTVTTTPVDPAHEQSVENCPVCPEGQLCDELIACALSRNRTVDIRRKQTTGVLRLTIIPPQPPHDEATTLLDLQSCRRTALIGPSWVLQVQEPPPQPSARLAAADDSRLKLFLMGLLGGFLTAGVYGGDAIVETITPTPEPHPALDNAKPIMTYCLGLKGYRAT